MIFTTQLPKLTKNFKMKCKFSYFLSVMMSKYNVITKNSIYEINRSAFTQKSFILVRYRALENENTKMKLLPPLMIFNTLCCFSKGKARLIARNCCFRKENLVKQSTLDQICCLKVFVNKLLTQT